MISKEEVKRIAKLARIKLSSEEVLKFQKELSLILDYIEQLKEVDISKIDLKKDLGKAQSVTREDKEIKKSLQQASKLMELAPDKKDNYLKTKKIL
jgi:aspartyl-tRNA(Asn)/glutamyl-tRNA(Gln) amidotransferase subunit C